MIKYAEIQDGCVIAFIECKDDAVKPIFTGTKIQAVLVTESLYTSVNIGDYHISEKFEPQTRELNNLYYRNKFNTKRSELFQETLWVRERHMDRIAQNNKTESTEEEVEWGKWINYWQLLRDLPNTVDFDARDTKFPVRPDRVIVSIVDKEK